MLYILFKDAKITSFADGKFNRLVILEDLFDTFFFFFCLFAISRATRVAYGGSQARGLIGAVFVGLHQSHSSVGSEPCL